MSLEKKVNFTCDICNSIFKSVNSFVFIRSNNVLVSPSYILVGELKFIYNGFFNISAYVSYIILS